MNKQILSQIIQKANYASRGIDGRIRPKYREEWYLETFKEIKELAKKLTERRKK